MVKIRLALLGRKNGASYRVVAIDETKAVRGEPLDYLGVWNPGENKKSIDKKKIDEWVKRGAQISQAVKDLL